ARRPTDHDRPKYRSGLNDALAGNREAHRGDYFPVPRRRVYNESRLIDVERYAWKMDRPHQNLTTKYFQQKQHHQWLPRHARAHINSWATASAIKQFAHWAIVRGRSEERRVGQ